MKTNSNRFKNKISHNEDTPPADTTSQWWQEPLEDILDIGTTYLDGLINGNKTQLPQKPADDKAPGDNTAMYVSIGAGALAFIVVILVLLKK